MTGKQTYDAEEKLRTYQFMIESAHDAIFFKDLESRYIIANNKTLEAFGLPREDVIGKNDYELMPDKNEAKKNVDDDQIVFKTAESTEVTKHMTGSDGKEYWFQAIKVPQFDNNGNVIGLVGIARDITKRKQIEETLKENEEKYRNLIERANDGVIIVQDGIVKFVNNRVTDLFGYSVDEMCDTPFLDYVFPDDRKRIMELHERRLKQEDVPDIYEMQALHKNGKILDVETNSGIVTYHGKPAVLAFIRDITERKRTEEELHKSESKLSAMLESIGDHMSMVDKDLNIIWTNEIAKKIFGNDIVGKKCYEIYHKRTEPCKPYPCITLQAFQDGKNHEHETQVIDRHRKTIFFHCTANVALRDKEGKPAAVLEISRDITEKVRADNALQKAKDELEHRVKERTKELEIKSKNLEEFNTAMEVLLKKREEDKTVLEDNVLANVKGMIGPYLKKIKKTKMDDQQKVLLSIIESNLREIISPFSNKLSSKYINLTPAEIQVADFVRHGKRNKEMADLLNLSVKTIESHRESIRKKIGITNKKTNLRSYLLSLR